MFVLTPIPSHYSIIKQIHANDLPRDIFIEKTLTSSYDKSEELCKLTNERTDINMVGYMKRFSVCFNQVKKLLLQNAIGDLISFDAYAFSSDFADAPKGSTISKGRGGVLEDLGSHVMDLALWFFGGLEVTSAKVNFRICPDSEDDVNFTVKGSKNLEGKFEVSWCKNGYRMPEFGMRIVGTKGNLKVSDDDVRLELEKDGPQRWYRHDLDDHVGFLLGAPEYYREDKHFIDSLLYRQGTKSDFQSALKVDQLIKQVRSKLANE